MERITTKHLKQPRAARGRYRRHGANVPELVRALPAGCAWAAVSRGQTWGFLSLADLRGLVPTDAMGGCALFERRYGKWRRVTERYVNIASC